MSGPIRHPKVRGPHGHVQPLSRFEIVAALEATTDLVARLCQHIPRAHALGKIAGARPRLPRGANLAPLPLEHAPQSQRVGPRVVVHPPTMPSRLATRFAGVMQQACSAQAFSSWSCSLRTPRRMDWMHSRRKTTTEGPGC